MQPVLFSFWLVCVFVHNDSKVYAAYAEFPLKAWINVSSLFSRHGVYVKPHLRKNAGQAEIIKTKLVASRASQDSVRGGSTEFSFNITHSMENGRFGSGGLHGRVGKLQTPHGIIDTPAFFPCGTKAAMKGLTVEQAESANTQAMLCNTYHLIVYPGDERIAKLGGLHKFTGWRRPILTDSGGYQIFSMSHGSVSSEIKGSRASQGLSYTKEVAPSLEGRSFPTSNNQIRITEDGTRFRSYYNGKTLFLSPEEAIRAQHNLGADLIVVLDECTPFHVSRKYTEASMRRSSRWASRCLNEHLSLGITSQALYGIIQGGVFEDLRDESVAFLSENPFFGTAIGGSLGDSKELMYATVGIVSELLKKYECAERPIHLLGVGGLADIFFAVEQGVDSFDCTHPTRLGRHGGALVTRSFWDKDKAASYSSSVKEHIRLSKSYFEEDDQPIDATCLCYTCRHHSRAYLHHLLKTGEQLGGSLISAHNLYFMNRMMLAIRLSMRQGSLKTEREKWLHPDLEV